MNNANRLWLIKKILTSNCLNISLTSCSSSSSSSFQGCLQLTDHFC
jgi:hypothetical protein